MGPNGAHELAPPALRCAVEHGAPAIRDRWHQDIRSDGVLVDLACASQRDKVAEAVGERLSERGTGQTVGILAAYHEFSLTSARAGRHLLRCPIGHLGSPPAVPFVELLVGNRSVQQLSDLGERVRPRTVYRPRRRFDRGVGLRPADLGPRIQPQVLELRRGQTGLDLQIARPWPAQPLLPAPTAGGRAPTEQLATAQLSGGGLHQPAAVGLHCGDPRPSLGRHLEEVVCGSLRRQWVADIGARVGERDVDPRDGSVVLGPPGLSGGGQDPHARFLRSGDVRPPVERFGLGVGVADADESKQQWTVLGQQQVDREHQISGALPLPDPQCGSAGGRHAACEDRSARRGRVAGGAQVPLDAAGEPGVGEGEVGELQAPVGEHQIPVGHQLAQRPEPAPETRKH